MYHPNGKNCRIELYNTPDDIYKSNQNNAHLKDLIINTIYKHNKSWIPISTHYNDMISNVNQFFQLRDGEDICLVIHNTNTYINDTDSKIDFLGVIFLTNFGKYLEFKFNSCKHAFIFPENKFMITDDFIQDLYVLAKYDFDFVYPSVLKKLKNEV